ncbi:uncharacterized protein [Epargyreus clarus]|uniref:uncharacterized protein n=1 Tax=Epargyreus clarus TaxID=520877 RepID=UPI003C2EF4CF
MDKVMEVSCKEKCQCCKACKAGLDFQKILDLKDAGLVIYRHTKRIDEIDKRTGILESTTNITDDVFIIHNTKDIQVKGDYCGIIDIDDNVSCPRCRELVQRAQKYLKNIPSIDKKDVISVCDHCQTKKKTIKYCCECHEVVKKFLIERDKQSERKEEIKTWLSKIHKLLSKNVVSDKIKRLKCHAYSELYLNKLYKDTISSTRTLEVEPMLEVGAKITESARTVDKVATKSEGALKFLDSKRTTFKSGLLESGSFIKIKRHASSSLMTYDTSLDKDIDIIKEDLGQDSFDRLRQKRYRDEEFERKTIIKHRGSPRTLKKYYSDEKIFFSPAGFEDLEDIKRNFSYVFPKGNEHITPLRKVKTSAELIEDTKDKLRLRAQLINDEINRQLAKRSEVTSSKKQKQSSIKSEKKDVEDLQKPSPKKAKPEDKEIKSNKKPQKVIESTKEKADQKKDDKIRDMDKKESTKEKAAQKKEEKIRDMDKKQKEKKEDSQKEKERKEKEKQFQQRLKEEQNKPKGEKIKNKDEKPQKVDNNATENLKKMIEEQAKLKAEAIKIKKQHEEENTKLRMEAERKAKEEEELKLKHNTKEEPTTKDLHIKSIKSQKPSNDDLILQLVKLKQRDRLRPKRLSEINITPLIVNKHKVHKGKTLLNCVLCVDSELELDVENILNNKNKPDEVTDLIVGNKIVKSRHHLSDKPAAEELLPVLYKTLFTEDMEPKQQNEMTEETKGHKPELSHRYVIFADKSKTKKADLAEQERPKGIIHYALSDRSFIDKGWTMLPTEKIVRKMNVYKMRPAHPEFDWFNRNKNKRLMLYDTGEKLAEFDDNGRGRWFYRNGRIALDYYDAEETHAQQRFVIYGSGEPDERGRYQPISILATFDYLGNGVVFDHAGKIRLKYNQTEGVVLDRNIGPASHWKWHTLNDPPVLQQVMIDTQMSHKDPDILKLGGPADDKVRPDNEEMLAIEFDNFIKEKSKKLSQKFKPFQIRMKAMKINQNFSLKVLDQANIYLIFRDGTTNIKMNIGMILDHHEIVDTDTAEVGEVSNSLERFPARTDSLAGLQQSVAYAQRVERLRVERERRLTHQKPVLSADRLLAAASRPLKPQLKIPSNSTVARDECYCKCRKPLTSNVYYDTRIVQ